MNHQAAAQLTKLINDLWPAQAVTTPDAAAVWITELLPLDHTAAHAAILELYRTSPYRPTPAQVSSHTTSGHDAAIAAWTAALGLMRSRGSYATAEEIAALPDDTIATIRSCGGWRWLCEQDLEQARRIFAKHYEPPRRLHAVPDTPALPGPPAAPTPA